MSFMSGFGWHGFGQHGLAGLAGEEADLAMNRRCFEGGEVGFSCVADVLFVGVPPCVMNGDAEIVQRGRWRQKYPHVSDGFLPAAVVLLNEDKPGARHRIDVQIVESHGVKHHRCL